MRYGRADEKLDTTHHTIQVSMYSEEQYHRALEVYEETKSIAKTMSLLGYPARRQTLYNWINLKGSVKNISHI